MKREESSKDTYSLSRREFLETTTKKSAAVALGFSILSTVRCDKPTTEMPKRVLGRTGISVSLLGFGCTQVKNKPAYTRAVELGVNYFHMGDRDPTYNLDACEALLPYRDQIHVAYMSHPKESRTLLIEDLDSFLQQSGLDYLDVWFVITPKPEVVNEFHEAVEMSRKAGKIRWSGITTHSLDKDVPHLTAPESPIDVVMMTYNYLAPPEAGEQLGWLHDAGVGITPMKPLAGKFYEKTTNTPDALLRWLAADSRIHSIPVNMNTVEQVENNVVAIQQPLSEDDRQILRTTYAYNSRRFCRMCRVCDGQCPNGLAVSDLVRTAMYVDGYKDMNLARANFSSIAQKSRRISCDTCDQCVVSCPNGVAVQERICRVKTWLV